SSAPRTSCSISSSRRWTSREQVVQPDSIPDASPGPCQQPVGAAVVEPLVTSVVIAEDEAIIRLDLKETLVEEGYDVVGETGRGDEAVDLARSLRPHGVLLDIKM